MRATNTATLVRKAPALAGRATAVEAESELVRLRRECERLRLVLEALMPGVMATFDPSTASPSFTKAVDVAQAEIKRMRAFTVPN